MPTLNWVYGAKSPDLAETIEKAIHAAHSYRNKLCELELDKRERHYELLRRLAPEFVAAEQAVAGEEAKLGEVREAIQAERVKQRTKTPKGIGQLTKAASEAKGRLKAARAKLKEAKLAAYADPAVITAMDHNTARHREEWRQAKEASGLYWGTEAIVRAACNSFASGAPPRFARYGGEGQLAVQLQGGLDCGSAERYNTLCYVEPREGKHADCYFRIGSDGGKPVFARVPIVFHRPLPVGKIKWAYLERRKIADHVRWSIRLTIDVEPTDTPRDASTWAAVHCGWMMQPSGLRVALWQGSDGKRGAVVLPHEHLADYERLDVIRSSRDREFNQAIEMLREFCKSRSDLPEWLAEVAPNLHAWRSQARLASLVLKWRDRRFAADDVFDALCVWRKRDKHLWQHERRLAVRVVRRRKDLYRKFAKALSDQYGVLYYAKINAKELTENAEPEELERDNTLSHRRAKQAAVSEFVRLLCEKFPLHAIAVSTVNLSRQCHYCDKVATSEGRKVQCRECGRTWDIDENALANTIARGQAMQKGGSLLELSAAQEDKAAKKKEKLAKMQEANRTARKKKREARETQG